MRKVCLLNRVSVRSQISRDKNNSHGLTKEESMYSIILKKDFKTFIPHFPRCMIAIVKFESDIVLFNILILAV